MLVTARRDPELYWYLHEKNLERQYDLLQDFIEIGVGHGPQAFDKQMLWALNHAAVAGISQYGGRFREEPIYVGRHIPPHFDRVPGLMDRYVSFIHENWDNMSAEGLAAYGLWRLNWIHPFIGPARSPARVRRDGAPKGNRTPVSGVRGRRPRPLDDGGAAAGER